MAEQKAEKAGGITNLGKTVGAPASTFFRVLKGGSPPGADKLLDWISPARRENRIP
mgnify:CR=1 FL=1